MSASIAQACGMSIEDTNISVQTARRRGMQNRAKKPQLIKDTIEIPDGAFIHWDGKIMKVKGESSSDRCCIYISGIKFNNGEDEVQNIEALLGVPEIHNGTGSAQEKVLTRIIKDWNLGETIAGMVFDTTGANTGIWQGAATLFENSIGHAILWVACRHHVYELHAKHVTGVVTGETKDPGVRMFRRLKAKWHKMTIDYTNLVKFDWNNENKFLIERAEIVLE